MLQVFVVGSSPVQLYVFVIDLQSKEHPIPAPASSHTSSSYQSPSPQVPEQLKGVEHEYPVIGPPQVELHPLLSFKVPSSHTSAPAKMPSPHIG